MTIGPCTLTVLCRSLSVSGGVSDSETAEFLDTIEAQKLQILSLEESLEQVARGRRRRT